MPDELTPDEVERISAALEQGNKIEAIKLYRSFTDNGLKESKDFIDVLVPQLKQQDPERFARLNAGASVGCSTNLLFVAIGLGAAIWTMRLLT